MRLRKVGLIEEKIHNSYKNCAAFYQEEYFHIVEINCQIVDLEHLSILTELDTYAQTTSRFHLKSSWTELRNDFF